MINLLHANEIKCFSEYISSDPVKARGCIEHLDYDNNAFLLNCMALSYRDESVFHPLGRQRTKFLKRKLKTAKYFIDLAFSLNPDCLEVLFTKGTIYDYLGEKFTSIDCYLEILEKKDFSNTMINCSNSDQECLKMMINDSYFQLYRLFHNIKEKRISNKFLKEYRSGLNNGIETIYVPLSRYLIKQ